MKFRLALTSSLLALAAPLALAQSSTWTIDPSHSEVGFTVKHLSISNVRGRFGKVNGVIHYNEASISKSTVTATIDVAAVDTGESSRDAHLKTPDFFDTAQFPTATFTSTAVYKNNGLLKIAGNLTVHGVTKPVVLDVEGPSAPIEGADHKLRTAFSATTTLDRTAFAIGGKFPAAAVGNEVKLTIDLEAVKQ